MAGGIKVTPEQLAAVSGRVNTGASRVDGVLGELSSAVAPLGSDWAGAAQVRFQSLWDDWQRNARGLHDALTGISSLMSQAGSSYAQAEEQIASSFGRM
ncbi:MAG TPA: WXG100 family type VII secretion target [Mycobacteriales bacterium]|nr:WXG100 family type VII secretion target [Mycobacteriales bacterium]